MYGLQWLQMKLSGFYSAEGWYFKYIVPGMCGVAAGYAFGYVAGAMAPHGKAVAAAIMTTLLGVFWLVVLVLAWAQASYSMSEAIVTSIDMTATFVGAVSASVAVARETPRA